MIAHRGARRRRRTAGFTMVEMLVVIGVIIFLVGLTVSVGTVVVEQSQKRRTADALGLLDLAIAEWETSAGRQLTWWDDHDPPAAWSRRDIHADTEDVLIISEMLELIGRTPAATSILRRIDPKLMYVYEADVYPRWLDTPAEQAQMDDRFAGAQTILDAWGEPIYATHPGRPYEPTVDIGPRDEDGTNRTYNEMTYGTAVNGRICFVSAGPDGRFGDLLAAPGVEAHDQTLDNVWSYEPARP